MQTVHDVEDALLSKDLVVQGWDVTGDQGSLVGKVVMVLVDTVGKKICRFVIDLAGAGGKKGLTQIECTTVLIDTVRRQVVLPDTSIEQLQSLPLFEVPECLALG